MFRDELTHYLGDALPTAIFDTKNFYEFTMAAIKVNDEWYVIIENPDTSRVEDIDDVILEEFDAQVEGWCVLKNCSRQVKSTLLPFEQGRAMQNVITYRQPPYVCWLLKVKPSSESRLVA